MTVLTDVALPQVNVLGSTMAYREAGNPKAPVALFLHGNPISSYIWRNILPLVAPVAHCIARDLIGFGRSGKPDIEYRFADHVRFQLSITTRLIPRTAFVSQTSSALSSRSSENSTTWISGILLNKDVL